MTNLVKHGRHPSVSYVFPDLPLPTLWRLKTYDEELLTPGCRERHSRVDSIGFARFPKERTW